VTLFLVEQQKITQKRKANQYHNQPIFCCILQHSILFTEPKKTLKTTKQIPSYSQAKNHCDDINVLCKRKTNPQKGLKQEDGKKMLKLE
jgi:hypothetical protein